MRIVHVINSLATGGAETLVVDLAREAEKNGDEAEIVTLVEQDGSPLRQAKEYGIKVTALGKSMRSPLLPAKLNNATRHADVVHVHLFPAQYMAAIFPKKPLLFTEHSSWNRRMEKRFLQPLESWVYAQYQSVFAISTGVLKISREYLHTLRVHTPVVEARNGIGEQFYAVQRPERDVSGRVVIVGSLKESKQQDLAIKAISTTPNLHLQIAGDGPLREHLESLARDLSVEQRVEFLGQVDDIPELLAQNDILLSCSKFEGFGLVAAEAQAVGLPVIGPDVDGFNEVVIDGVTGHLYRDRDPENIGRIIMTAMEPAEYTRLSANAREHAKRFSIAESFRVQREVYEAVIAGRPVESTDLD